MGHEPRQSLRGQESGLSVRGPSGPSLASGCHGQQSGIQGPGPLSRPADGRPSEGMKQEMPPVTRAREMPPEMSLLATWERRSLWSANPPTHIQALSVALTTLGSFSKRGDLLRAGSTLSCVEGSLLQRWCPWNTVHAPKACVCMCPTKGFRMWWRVVCHVSPTGGGDDLVELPTTRTDQTALLRICSLPLAKPNSFLD